MSRWLACDHERLASCASDSQHILGRCLSRRRLVLDSAGLCTAFDLRDGIFSSCADSLGRRHSFILMPHRT